MKKLSNLSSFLLKLCTLQTKQYARKLKLVRQVLTILNLSIWKLRKSISRKTHTFKPQLMVIKKRNQLLETKKKRILKRKMLMMIIIKRINITNAFQRDCQLPLLVALRILAILILLSTINLIFQEMLPKPACKEVKLVKDLKMRSHMKNG